MEKISKNPFEALRKRFSNEESQNRLNARLENTFQHETFSKKWNFFYNASKTMSYVIQFINGSIALGFIFLILLEVTLPLGQFGYLCAGFGALVIAILLEPLKRISLSNSLKEWFQYKNFAVIYIGIASCAVIVSAITSYKGGQLLGQKFITPPTLLNAKSIDKTPINRLEKIIANLRAEKETIRKERRYKGKLASKDSKRIDKINLSIQSITDSISLLQSNIIALEDKHHAETQTFNNTITSNYHTSKKEKALEVALFTLSLEVIFIGCLLFNWWFKWTAFEELRANAKDPISAQNNPLITYKSYPRQRPSQNEAERVVIKGFKQRTDVVKPSITELYATKTDAVEKSSKRTCLHCGKEYKYMIHNQKFCSKKCRKKEWDKKNIQKTKKQRNGKNTTI